MKARPLLATPIQRFEVKIDRSGGPDACHIWMATVTPAGYGQFWVNGKFELAHRFAWAQANGPIPKGTSIRHICDNSLCVNSRHLLDGTQLDNMRDRQEHGAGYARGEAHSRAVLTEAMVLEAADLRRQRWSWNRIAVKLGVTRSTISRAAQGETWGHIDAGEVPTHTITTEMIEEAEHLHAMGASWRSAARQIGTSHSAMAYARTKRKRP